MQLLSPAAAEIKKEFQSNEAVCGKVLTLFHLASNKTRFRIICMLARGEFCVNEIVEVLGKGKPSNVSQQLKILTLAGLLNRRREGRQILYVLADDRLRDMVEFLRDRFLDPEVKATQ
jgi:DNA-binding transcriptional ArsR family regulator